MAFPSKRASDAAQRARNARAGNDDRTDELLTAIADLADAVAVLSRHQTARSEVDPDQEQ